MLTLTDTILCSIKNYYPNGFIIQTCIPSSCNIHFLFTRNNVHIHNNELISRLHDFFYVATYNFCELKAKAFRLRFRCCYLQWGLKGKWYRLCAQ